MQNQESQNGIEGCLSSPVAENAHDKFTFRNVSLIKNNSNDISGGSPLPQATEEITSPNTSP